MAEVMMQQQQQPDMTTEEDMMQEEGATVTYQTIELLQEQGIGINDIQKLKAAGYHTIESVCIVQYDDDEDNGVLRSEISHCTLHPTTTTTTDRTRHRSQAIGCQGHFGSQGVEIEGIV